MSRVDLWKIFLTICEEIKKCLQVDPWEPAQCSSVAEKCVLAIIRGLRQALTRIGCLHALESGPTVEEPCPAEMVSYDHAYNDDVTGASRFPLTCVKRQCRLRSST